MGGPFACDAHSTFSSKRLLLGSENGHDLYTEDIGDLHCEFGGEWYLALNSEVFVRAWKQVFKDGLAWQAQWTVKVDPDCVFLPNRLRKLVREFDPDDLVYLNNCDEGLHGPLEVISRGGMNAFMEGMDHCVDKLKKEWTDWGEDVFLRHCLGILKVNRVDQFKLLSEDHCFHEDPAKDGCVSGKTAFHPFKTPEAYFKCKKQAEDSETADVIP